MKKQSYLTPLLTLLISSLSISTTTALEVTSYIGLENLSFIHNPLDNQQHNHYLSGNMEIEFFHEWDEGTQSLAFVPFFRYSQHDNKRTHFDIRELTWVKVANDWELRVGIRKDFWGVSESQHLVDIINQTDLVENFDTEDKLGQPMINLALINDWGTIDLYLLTGFREQTFSGQEGRFRSFPEVNTGEAEYEKHGIEKHLAYAIRWAHTMGNWDFGLSHFYGTSRAPSFLIKPDKTGQVDLIPYYEMIHQSGIDIQITQDNVLWKLESIVRSGQGNTYFAATAGFEYTFYNTFETGLDIGIVAEYLYDSRGGHAPVIFEDDFLAGIRLGFNDVQNTEILAGVIFDRRNNTKFYNVEASRRFGENWKVELESRFFSSTPASDPAYFLREDDHIRLDIRYYF